MLFIFLHLLSAFFFFCWYIYIFFVSLLIYVVKIVVVETVEKLGRAHGIHTLCHTHHPHHANHALHLHLLCFALLWKLLFASLELLSLSLSHTHAHNTHNPLICQIEMFGCVVTPPKETVQKTHPDRKQWKRKEKKRKIYSKT